MVEWLSETSGLRLHVAEEGDKLRGGHAYFAPDGLRHGCGQESASYVFAKTGRGVTKPSVSHLFRSVAEVYGERSVGVLLTGMGRDGAEELKLMKDKGALTVAQDKESSVVFGMPGEAVRINAATYVLPPARDSTDAGNAGRIEGSEPGSAFVRGKAGHRQAVVALPLEGALSPSNCQGVK